MNSVTEIDSVIKNCIKLLHSNHPDSTAKLQITLDEIIRQKYGTNKMLVNIFGKKFLYEDISASPASIKRQKSDDSNSSDSGRNTLSPLVTKESLTATKTNIVNSNNVSLSVIGESGEEENLTKDFGDLACVVCGAMVFTAGNRLIECTECHSLYHQECHKPYISDTDASEHEFSWCCSHCRSEFTYSGGNGRSGYNETSSISSNDNNVTSSNIKVIIPSSSNPISSHSSSSISSSASSSSLHHKNSEGDNLNLRSLSISNTSKNDTSSYCSGRVLSKSKSFMAENSFSTCLDAESSGSGSNSNKMSTITTAITPNISIVSSDKNIENTKKKSVKQQEYKKKHKSRLI